MKDFANFESYKSFFVPSRTHLNVYSCFDRIDPTLMADGDWSYKVKIFCSVPIIIFRCNQYHIIMHLNMPFLQQMKACSWLEAQHLTFRLSILDAWQDHKIIHTRGMSFAAIDSERIRLACRQQCLFSCTQIEDIVSIIYQSDISKF